MVSSSPYSRFFIAAAVGALIASACGGATTPAASAAPASAAVAAAPTAVPFKGTKTFKVVFTSIGLSSTPMLAAIDALRKDGFTIDTPEIAESELALQGLAKGDFAFGSGTTSGVLAVAEKGAKIKILMDRLSSEWTVYATANIKTCADLDGKKLAIHSEGAVSSAMVRDYLNTNCPAAKPNFLIVPGSDNRLAALLAGQIDASPLELSDAIALEAKGGAKFVQVTNFAKTLPTVHPTTVYANGDFLTANPDSARALIKAILLEHRKIAGNAKYLEDITVKYFPKIAKETLPAAAKQYVDLKMFDVNGGLTPELVQASIDFFAAAGSIKAGMKVSDVSDFSHLNLVLQEIGKK